MASKKAVPAGRRQKQRDPGTVLVTGASGRLGRRLCGEFLDSGLEVRGLVGNAQQINTLPPGTVPFVGDITEEAVLRRACSGADAVYHLAAIVSQRSRGPKEIIRVNAHGTAAVLKAAESEKVRSFIFPSSVDVYGIRRSEVLTEESSVHPTDMYGHSKALAEHQITHFGGRLRYTIFRTAAIYGPGFESSFFKVFRMISEGRLYIVGDGNNSMSLVHINDVTKAMALAESSDRGSSIYNLSDGKRYTQNQLVEMASGLLNVPVPRKHVGVLMARMFARAAGIDQDELRFITSNRILDTSKIRKELGFRPRMQMQRSAKELVDMFLMGYKGSKTGVMA